MEHRCSRAWLDARCWSWIFLVALVVRMAYTLVVMEVDPFLRANPLHGDAGSYDRIARNLLAGQGFAEAPGVPTAFWPPLYPLFLAGLYRLCGYSLLAPRLLQAILGAVTVVATARAAHGLFGRRVAVLTGLGLAFYPHLIYFGAWLIAEALYLALLALALLVAVKLQKRPAPRNFVLLGALLGLGALAKPAALLLVPLFVLWTWLAPPVRPLRQRLARGLLFVLVCGLVIAPWTVRNYLVFQDFVPISTNGGYTFYGANNADAFGGHREGFPLPIAGLTQPQAEREYYRLGIEWITHHPAGFARLVARKLARLFSPLSVASYERDFPLPFDPAIRAVYSVFLALALAGALLSLRHWRHVLLFYLPAVQVFIGTVIFYGDARYTLPMTPSLVVFAAVSLLFAKNQFNRLRQARSARQPSPCSGSYK